MRRVKDFHRWLWVALVAALPIGLAACQGFTGDTSCESNPAAAWRVTLPPSAGEVEERCAMNLVNPSYTATFTLSPDDLETFLSDTGVRDWQTEAAEAVIFADEAAQMDSLLLGRSMDGIVSLEVVIDTSDPGLYRVFYDATYID